MRRSIALSITTIAIAGMALPVVADPGNKYPDETVIATCDSDTDGSTIAEIIYTGPKYLWPPNHKMVEAHIIVRDINDEDMIEAAGQISHDEMVDGEEMNGSGNTGTDSSIAGGDAGAGETEFAVELRSERSGQGDGRVYTISVQAEIENTDASDGGEDTFATDTCTGSTSVSVPHDMRGGAGWKHDEDGDGQGDRGNGGGVELLGF